MARIGLVALTAYLSSCCGRPPKYQTTEEQEPQHSQIVNFYVENSGSMRGYFTGNSQIKDIIKEYYDRIHERQEERDTISLNFINTQIEVSSCSIKDFLLNCKDKCTASYTKIDDILTMAMEGINDSTSNIVVSDYCFTSNDSSFPMAQSGITEIFTKRLKTDKRLAVVIVKYMSDFNGKYYPGGIACNKPLPFYIWIFGNEKQVKKIFNAPVKSHNCGTLILQPCQNVMFNIITQKARMVNGNAIVVKEWKKERNRDTTKYSVTLELDLSKVILPKESICNTNNYSITESYTIESIEEKENDVYSFNISTSKPSPGTVSIAYIQQEMPEWIEKSNYEGTGIPTDSTTLGVKYLIGGVYDAYQNMSNKLFETKITLK